MKKVLWIFLLFSALITACKKTEKQSAAVLTTAPVTNVTANGAQTGGTITSNGGSTISNKGVCWAIHSGPTISDSILSAGSGNTTFTSSISNLNANTTYYVKAFAINGQGTAYGNEISFTTAKGVPTVTTTAITNNQALTAQTGGNVTNDGGSTITATGVVWSTLQHPTISDSKISNSNPGTGLFSDTLTSLTLAATYYVRAYAVNSYGIGYGNEISFTVSAAGTVTDFDGNVYTTVTIGGQTWMASNLKTSHYQNGDPIIDGTNNFDWFQNMVISPGGVATGPGPNLGAFTYPNTDSANNQVYGKLYNTGAILDTRKICPSGWHVSSDTDWQQLEFSQGMDASDTGIFGNRGNIATKLLVGGSSGMNFQMAGLLLINYNNFTNQYLGVLGTYWTSTVIATPDPSSTNNFDYIMTYRQFITGLTFITRNYIDGYGASVRCVKN